MTQNLSPLAASLSHAIEDRSACVAVVGLGYVGLPLVGLALSAGFRVIGHDIDSSRISALSQGRSYIGHISSPTVASWLTGDRFSLSTDPECLADADAVLVCVPTPLTRSREPDLSAV